MNKRIIILISVLLLIALLYSCKNNGSKNIEKKVVVEIDTITTKDTIAETLLIVSDSGNLVLVESSTTDTLFRSNWHGLTYRFIERNNGETPEIGDILSLNLEYRTSFDSVLFTSKDVSGGFRMRLEKPAHPGSIEEAFQLMHIGDSAIFKIDAYNFYTYSRNLVQVPYFAKEGSYITFHVRLKDIQQSEDYKIQRKEREIRIQDEENSMINRYLLSEEINIEPLNSGLYIIPIIKTDKEKVKVGSIVSIHYSASFLDGREFDNTNNTGIPFAFELGKGDIIPGLEQGISHMSLGETARFIVPFRLAYGGESKGPIPPYSTLLFDVEIVSVK